MCFYKIYIYTYKNEYTHIYIYTYIHTYVYTYMYTRIQHQSSHMTHSYTRRWLFHICDMNVVCMYVCIIQCARRRQAESRHDPALPAINILITILGSYFGQVSWFYFILSFFCFPQKFPPNHIRIWSHCTCLHTNFKHHTKGGGIF